MRQRTRHSCSTVRPPTPESNTPIGRGTDHGWELYGGAAAHGAFRISAWKSERPRMRPVRFDFSTVRVRSRPQRMVPSATARNHSDESTVACVNSARKGGRLGGWCALTPYGQPCVRSRRNWRCWWTTITMPSGPGQAGADVHRSQRDPVGRGGHGLLPAHHRTIRGRKAAVDRVPSTAPPGDASARPVRTRRVPGLAPCALHAGFIESVRGTRSHSVPAA